MATVDQIRITRTIIPDLEEVFGDSETETLFSDSEISDFVTAGGDNVLRAAGLANLAIATSEALISKVIRTQDLQTNGAAVATALTEKAKVLFARADKEETRADMGYFDIIDYGEGWGIYPPELTEPNIATYW